MPAVFRCGWCGEVCTDELEHDGRSWCNETCRSLDTSLAQDVELLRESAPQFPLDADAGALDSRDCETCGTYLGRGSVEWHRLHSAIEGWEYAEDKLRRCTRCRTWKKRRYLGFASVPYEGCIGFDSLVGNGDTIEEMEKEIMKLPEYERAIGMIVDLETGAIVKRWSYY